MTRKTTRQDIIDTALFAGLRMGLEEFERVTAADTCRRCAGIGSVCLACDLAIDDCDCREDSMPCGCTRCHGTGLEPEFEADA